MSGVTVRFDAVALRQGVNAIIEDKVRAVTKNEDVYIELSNSWLRRLQDSNELPKDTGALSTGDIFMKGTNEREGQIFISKDGIKFDPIEYHEYVEESRLHHPGDSETIHYANFDAVQDAVYSANAAVQNDPGQWRLFTQEAAEILTRAMKNG